MTIREKSYSRSEWCERGRVVVVENNDAVDVVSYWEAYVRGARHVFNESQTLPIERSEAA